MDPSAASSSPLWSLLLASIYLVLPKAARGYFEYSPLIINVTVGLCLIGLWRSILGNIPRRDIWICGLVLIVPLSALTMLGMEHLLHVLISTALTFSVSKKLSRSEPSDARDVTLTIVLSIFATACRYESVFLIGALAIAAIAFRRFRVGAALLVGAAIPICFFGALWVHNGGFLLPNAALLKATAAPVNALPGLGMWGHIAMNLLHNLNAGWSSYATIGLLVVAAFLFARTCVSFGLQTVPALVCFCSISATLGQIVFAGMGWLYRYEAWLIALLALASISSFEALHLRKRWAIALIGFGTLVSVPRAIEDFTVTALAADDRRLEHLAPAQFLAENYAGSTVMVDDIGAVSYFGNVRTLDIFGLGNNKPIKLRRSQSGYTPNDLRLWAKSTNTSIAIVQTCATDIWQLVPKEWALVAMWYIPRNVVFHDLAVGFYATSSEEAGRLRAMLKSYNVPPTVDLEFVPPDAPRYLVNVYSEQDCPWIDPLALAQSPGN